MCLKNKKMKLILDCDPGIDDLECIIMALDAPHVEIVAITTVAGNASADQIYVNAKKILYHCKRTDIPLYKGSPLNLMGNNPPNDNYFGSDGMCEMNLDYDDSVFKNENMSSPAALLYYVSKFPGEINLVSTGPLTNLAVAYLCDSTFPSKLASLHIMGGDRSERTTNNVTPYAEFNCHYDAFSWKIVMNNFKLSNNKKIVLVDFTFCQKNVLPFDFLKRYFKHPLCNDINNSQAYLIGKAYDFMSKKFTSVGDITCDPFALFTCIYPDYEYHGTPCILENIHLEGETFGHTEFKLCDHGNILLLERVDFDNFLRIFLRSVER